MKTLSAQEAKKLIDQLLDQASESHQPVKITGEHHNGILISEEMWQSIQETSELTQIPGLRDSIKEGLNTPLDQCDEKLDW
jgi:antitoxin YefM